MLRDQGAHVVDRRRGRGAAHQVEVAAVAGDPLERGPQPRVGAELGALPRLDGRGVALHDLFLDVLDLHGAGLLRQLAERGLHGDEALDEVLLLVLEAHVECGRLAGCGHVAGHLQRHGGLALSLGAADQHQLTRAQAATDRLIERDKAGPDRLELVDLARGDSLVQVGQHVERRARRQSGDSSADGWTSASGSVAVSSIIGAGAPYARAKRRMVTVRNAGEYTSGP